MTLTISLYRFYLSISLFDFQINFDPKTKYGPRYFYLNFINVSFSIFGTKSLHLDKSIFHLGYCDGFSCELLFITVLSDNDDFVTEPLEDGKKYKPPDKPCS